MANRAYWQRLSAERNIEALSKRMGWRVASNSEPESCDTDKPKPTLKSIVGGFVSDDDLNQRTLVENIAYFQSHPEFLGNHKRVPLSEDLINQRYLRHIPPFETSIDIGRKISREEFTAIASALRTLIRYHERKQSHARSS